MSDAALVAGLAFLSIVAQGHNFGVGNNAVYISWMGRLGPEPFFLNDWYLNTAPLHPIVIRPLIWLNQYLPLDWTFLAAHTLTRVLFCAGVYLMAFWMFGSRTAAALAVVFNILIPRISLGGHFAQASHFEANFLGFALATLAFAFYIRGRTSPRAFLLMGLFIGLTLLFHFFIGVSVAVILALTLALDIRRGELHWQWIVLPVMLALAIASPSLWEVFQSATTDEAVLTSAQVANVLAFRHPHHHAPFTWPLELWIFLLSYVAIWLIVSRRHLISLEIVTLVWVLTTCGLFVLCIEYYPFGPVAYFQFFRQTVFLTIFASIHMGGWSARIIDDRPRHPILANIYILLALALIATYRMPMAFIPVAVFVLIALAIFGKLIIQDRHKDQIGTSRTQETVTWGLLFIGAGMWVLGAQGQLNPLLARFRPQPHFAREIRAGSPEITEVCAWVRDNTPKESVFLIPPDIEEFRILSQRCIVVDWKTVPYRNAELREWFDRIARVTDVATIRAIAGETAGSGISILDDGYTDVLLKNSKFMIQARTISADELKTGYDKNSEVSIVFLARRYGAEYIISRKPFSKPALFSNNLYYVYAAH